MEKKAKIRLDVYLYEKGYFESREKARIAIMEGNVYVNNQKEDKPGTIIKEDAVVEYRGEKLKYVSRGGYKLEKAKEVFKLDFEDKICMDIGASTGGFTDLMLQGNAKLVYAIDSGTNQLDYRLRTDDRVVVLENTNARYLKKENIKDEYVDVITIDVSFISLTKIIPVVKNFLKDDGFLVALIKPQFEAGKEKVEKNGVIRDKKVHIDVIDEIVTFCKNESLYIAGLDFSPIKGPAGNIEFLIYLKKEICGVDDDLSKDTLYNIKEVVEVAHATLD